MTLRLKNYNLLITKTTQYKDSSYIRKLKQYFFRSSRIWHHVTA